MQPTNKQTQIALSLDFLFISQTPVFNEEGEAKEDARIGSSKAPEWNHQSSPFACGFITMGSLSGANSGTEADIPGGGFLDCLHFKYENLLLYGSFMPTP